MPLPIRFNRRQYVWAMIFLFLVAPILEVIFLVTLPATESLLKPVNTAILIMIALTTGARFKDAGYRPWIGVCAVFAIGVGIPVLAGTSYVFLLHGSRQELPIFAGVLAVVTMLLLLAFVIWAATRKSYLNDADLDVDLGEDTVVRNRIEPRF